MASSRGAIRLQKEFKALEERKDLANFIAAPNPDNIYEFHFCIFGLKDCVYEGGYYHGKLVFPPEYPHKPPAIYMITPNGRFMTGVRICMSFSDYHPELWNPMWGVSTIIVGLISFMNTNDVTAGSLKNMTDENRKKYAEASLAFNLNEAQNPWFKKMFSSE